MNGEKNTWDIDYASEMEREVLQRRAEQLAVSVRKSEEEDEGILVQVLVIGDERFGVDLSHIWEVFPVRAVTPVPGTPPMVRGAINFRGEIVPLYDLISVVTGAAPAETMPSGACVVLGKDQVDFAVAVDRVEPPVRVNADKLKPSLSRPGDRGYSFVRGFTDAGVVVLNPSAILQDESLIVDMEV